MNSEQVIVDLINLLNEDQLLEYLRSSGLKQYIGTSKRYTTLTSFMEEEARNGDPSRTLRMRDELLDFIFEEAIPPLGGIRFQKQVARWLKRKGDHVVVDDRVRGTLTHQKYHDVDIHVVKKGWLGTRHVWVETKVLSVGRPVIEKLERIATDVHLAKHRGIVDWAPDQLMAVSMKGFTKPALELARTRSIYCVRYHRPIFVGSNRGGRRYHFLGEMGEADYDNGKPSNYPKHPSTTY
jgi:hypothetical protein